VSFYGVTVKNNTTGAITQLMVKQRDELQQVSVVLSSGQKAMSSGGSEMTKVMAHP